MDRLYVGFSLDPGTMSSDLPPVRVNDKIIF
jgi:hypothetical protein